MWHGGRREPVQRLAPKEIVELVADGYERNMRRALALMRQRNPAAYLKLVISLMQNHRDALADEAERARKEEEATKWQRDTVKYLYPRTPAWWSIACPKCGATGTPAGPQDSAVSSPKSIDA